jgi:hypothetical protein
MQHIASVSKINDIYSHCGLGIIILSEENQPHTSPIIPYELISFQVPITPRQCICPFRNTHCDPRSPKMVLFLAVHFLPIVNPLDI